MSLCETHAPVHDTQPFKMGIAFCLIYTIRDTLWRPVPTLLSKWSNMTVDLTQAALQGQLKQFCSPAQLAFLREYSCKHLACSIPIVGWVHIPTLLLQDAAVHTSSCAAPWQRPLTLNFWKQWPRKVTFLVCHGQLPLLYDCIFHCIWDLVREWLILQALSHHQTEVDLWQWPNFWIIPSSMSKNLELWFQNHVTCDYHFLSKILKCEISRI